MLRRIELTRLTAVVAIVLGSSTTRRAFADDPAESSVAPTLSLPTPTDDLGPRHPIGPSLPRVGSSTTGRNSGGWLVGGLSAVALIGLAGASFAGRRARGRGGAGGLEVVGRMPLSAKHSACLIRAGDRLLLVGLGPQGPPALLGELDPTDLESAPSPKPTVRPGGTAR